MGSAGKAPSQASPPCLRGGQTSDWSGQLMGKAAGCTAIPAPVLGHGRGVLGGALWQLAASTGSRRIRAQGHGRGMGAAEMGILLLPLCPS